SSASLPLERPRPLPRPIGPRPWGGSGSRCRLRRVLSRVLSLGLDLGDDRGILQAGEVNGTQLVVDLVADLRVLGEELRGLRLALADARGAVGEPRAGLVDDAVVDTHGDQLVHLVEADAVDDL